MKRKAKLEFEDFKPVFPLTKSHRVPKYGARDEDICREPCWHLDCRDGRFTLSSECLTCGEEFKSGDSICYLPPHMMIGSHEACLRNSKS